ncbi:MAG: hypothetical protein HOP15_01550 [Planctomycetes bacterium]|nr:hypothetical protein [Planctomycetota bacterium]
MIHALGFLMTLGLAAQGGPSHAYLHPAGADAFLEFGDVGALLTALDKAPLARFLHDERLQPLLSELGQPADRSLKDLAKFGLSASLPEAKAEAWLDGLKAVSVSMVALGPGTDTTAAFGFQAVADLTTPEQAQALHAVIVARAPKHEPMTSALAGVERLHLGDTPDRDLWCAAVGTRLVVGGSADKPEDFAARAEKKLAGLDGKETFKKQLAALAPSTGTSVMWFALTRPLTDILATMKKEGGFTDEMDFLSQIPSDLNPLGSARLARMQLVGERFVTEMFSSETTAAAKKPVDPAWLEPVPSGQMIVYSSAFDGAAAGKRMRELLAKDEQSAAAVAALEQKLGFGLEKVLARLGPGLTVYASPIAGLGLPETRAWIDCDDPAAFTIEFEALVGALGETLPGYTAKTKPYKLKQSGSEEKIEVPVTTLSLPPGAIPIPMITVAPSFAPVGKKLVFGFSSMDVKNELKRVHSGDGEAIVAGVNPLAAMGLTLPAEARSVFVMDWAKLLGGLLGTVKAFAGMAPPEQMPFDLAKLPPGEMFAEYFKPTFHYSTTVAGGTYRRHEASFGPETWFGMVAGGMAAVQAQKQASPSAAPAGAPPDAPGGGQ